VIGRASNNYCQLWINIFTTTNENVLGYRLYITTTDVWGQASIPVHKGDLVIVSYTNLKSGILNFLYAEGSEND
jgi:hypothetical protein